MAPKEHDFLDERSRAEDILLGSLGYAEEARLMNIERTGSGYRGRGVFASGEEFDFVCEEELDELQQWALTVLQKQRR